MTKMETASKIDRYLEPGTKRWFEYHCWEDHRSSDALLWYHSHEQCEIMHCINPEYGDMSQNERFDAGMQLVYHVRFADGFEWDAFEDELLKSKKSFECEDPDAPEILLLWSP